MSNLFDEFLPEEPFFDVRDIETYEQRFLHDEFDLLAEKNMEMIRNFDPSHLKFEQPLLLHTPSEERELKEPEFVKLLMQNMLTKCGVDLPTKSDDPRVIFERWHPFGSRVTIYEIINEIGVTIPVHCHTMKDEYTPRAINLMSTDRLHEVVLGYEEAESQRSLLKNRMGITSVVASGIEMNDVRWFNATFDKIQNL